ncbi:MAG: 3-dehydroquinate synthase [Bacteroidota bacterium]
MIEKIASEKNRVEVGSITDSQLGRLLSEDAADAGKVVFVDENTHEHCWPYLLTSFESLKTAEVIVLPDGEENKTMEICFQVWQAMSEYKIKRGDLIINLGGGVVTDMGGFIASVYKRGISFINIPTTLLAMVDASVGGKTGINLPPWKNQLGTFSLPHFTFCDPIFLKTLPEREMRSGRAEMIKHGLISDAQFYETMITGFDALSEQVIARAVQLKADIVDRDPEEKNERKKLNFGHTVGHAIEGYCTQENRGVTHGDCVAWGMIAEAFLSQEIAGLDQQKFEAIERDIREIYGKAPIKENDIPALIELMRQDKKNTAETLNCTLLRSIGDSVIDGSVSAEQMRLALQHIIKN